MTPSEIEQTVGDFYGLHLQESGYHGNLGLAWLQGILKSLKISERRLEEMVCMEAGGAGNKALALAQMGCRQVHYIDLSEQNIRWMQDSLASRDGDLPIAVTHGSILDSNTELDESLDLIICTGVIHHTLDPAQALMHLHAWLKTSGILVVNCYRSGGLYFFWAHLIRDLLSLVNVDYHEFSYFVNLYDASIRKTELMDHAFVPVMNPTNAGTFRYDLDRLGFSILQGDDDDKTYHSTTNPMLHFIARKESGFDGALADLKYHHGIDQLSLDYDQPTQELLADFSNFKNKLASTIDRTAAVSIAVLTITRIFNECQDIEGGTVQKLRSFRKTKDFRVLLRQGNPKAHFFNSLRRYLRRCL